jgi:3',5'-cyclic-nucleotide phosphodiesterase
MRAEFMTDTTIIHISDTHFTPAGQPDAFNQQVNPFYKFDLVFSDIAKMATKPDFIVITGDLVHEGQAGDYVRLKALIDEESDQLKVPIFVVLGNHDRTAAFYDGFLDRPPDSKYYYKLTLGGLDNYFLDTTFEDLEPGYLDAKQLDWLWTQLEAHPRQPALIFMHHPLAAAALSQMRFSVLQNSTDLLNVCKAGNVKGIFAGHIHFPATYTTAGILNAVADSSAYHIDCRDPHHHYVNDAVGYNIIRVTDDQGIEVESRRLYWGQEIIKELLIDQTDFVDPLIFKSQSS